MIRIQTGAGWTWYFWIRDVQLTLALLGFQVILYSGDRAYEDYYEPMRGRVHFNSADPKTGDASINLTGLKSSDSGTYQCKVKKAPGIRSKKMLLRVMGEWHKLASPQQSSHSLFSLLTYFFHSLILIQKLWLFHRPTSSGCLCFSFHLSLHNHNEAYCLYNVMVK